MKKAILLINLGTPDRLNAVSIRRYLRTFLNDPRVIDIPAIWRWLLVNLVIVPFRYRKTQAAYRKIWQTQGSPLLSLSEALTRRVGEKLGEEYHVALAMRYGQPSIKSVLPQLLDTGSLTIIPLYPQYAAAATGSAIAEVMDVLSSQWNMPQLVIKNQFYDHPAFISAYASRIGEFLKNQSVDFVLFSYHGLPERHVDKSGCALSCDKISSCPAIDSANAYCYRAQCYATTEAIVKKAGLDASVYGVSFQSRLGRTPWIKPYTDMLLPDLLRRGIKKLAIVSPSFAVDCLETLEEIDIRTREQWFKLGGEAFYYIPCLNDSPDFVSALAEIARTPA
ncbi:MAG TPA: ferrochelatase [Gammaproteobacteria bacterium]|jgi:ferrochelatase|nr:ferrochelatase [Gammaproteobacteria bacterium]